MAFLEIKNVRISGVAAAVPEKIENNADIYQKWGGYDNFVSATGIESRRKSTPSQCSSDLCQSAAEKLIEELNWKKEEIEALVFVSQTPDYITPATSCLLQKKLGLSQGCYTLDISLGCSGWVYALSVVASLMQNGCIKKALLLAGDTITKFCSEEDKSTYPLFGDAGTATAVCFDNNASNMKFAFNTDGDGYEAIIIEDGGYRNPVNLMSFDMHQKGEGLSANKLQLKLDGMNVFAFGISKAPQSVNSLMDRYSIQKEDVDYFLFHQANLFMNEKIRKKLKLTPEQSPFCLREFGNTSCASIPLTMVSKLQTKLSNESLKHIACGFGVGLSWGSVYFETDKIVVPNILEL